VDFTAEVLAGETVAELMDALDEDGGNPHQRDVFPVEDIRERLVESLGVLHEDGEGHGDNADRNPHRLGSPNPPEGARHPREKLVGIEEREAEEEDLIARP